MCADHACYPHRVIAGMKRMYEEGMHTDFILAIGDKEWKLHKTVLLMHSDVLYKMSSSEAFVESKNGRAELKDVHPQQIDSLVEFLYTGDYKFPGRPESARSRQESVPTAVSELKFHISMMALADMYNIPTLNEIAFETVLFNIDARNMVTAARALYEDPDTPARLRHAISCTIGTYMSDLCGPEFDALLEDMPRLAIEVVKLQSKGRVMQHIREGGPEPWINDSIVPGVRGPSRSGA
ncbi:Putative BTB/POZ domain-containing protein [Septoria linicola]|uniref:BTB/POZ domain-containing protein n=1 Tax=Septoria linicola TaxID=215465 RepID=A0A9Q9AT07_9PEZI|nr:putative BTB/POZ domain-containing protein [Septoria linicola]USW54129.1 Putative BTB/POZ domain-containing protein [Septoria linicola]